MTVKGIDRELMLQAEIDHISRFAAAGDYVKVFWPLGEKTAVVAKNGEITYGKALIADYGSFEGIQADDLAKKLDGLLDKDFLDDCGCYTGVELPGEPRPLNPTDLKDREADILKYYDRILRAMDAGIRDRLQNLIGGKPGCDKLTFVAAYIAAAGDIKVE